jgi:hypothetical protein
MTIMYSQCNVFNIVYISLAPYDNSVVKCQAFTS